jgi:hypothetical protein
MRDFTDDNQSKIVLEVVHTARPITKNAITVSFLVYHLSRQLTE